MDFHIVRFISGCLALILFFSGNSMANPPLNALPTGGAVVSGKADISSNRGKMTVRQNTDKLITEWNTFNIGSEAGVQFLQPSSTSIALNRVLSTDASQIFGRISANGQVFLVNPAGVTFGSSARFSGSGFVVSTLDIDNNDFLNNNFSFHTTGTSNGIKNAGLLESDGGYLAFLSPYIENSGELQADDGSVTMIAADKVSLDFTGDGLINYTIDQGAVDAQIKNHGLIQADNGDVVMTAQAKDQFTQSVVNNSGIVRAQGVGRAGGRILLLAQGGGLTVNGSLDATSNTDQGGSVTATGDHVTIQNGARLSANGATGGGSVLVGGSWQNSDASVYQATTTTVEAGAKLEADATVAGDGGMVVAWSDVTRSDSVTQVHGTLEARGGNAGGDGGRIETSGHKLAVDGIQIDTGTVEGQSGEWLLDPYDITISNGPASGTAFNDANNPGDDTYESAATSTILASDIANALGNGSVTIQTGAAGADDGNITVSADILKTAGTDSTLTLKAHRDIALNNVTISSTSDALNLVLWSRYEGSGRGEVAISGSTISTNGGHVAAGGGINSTTWNGLTVASDKAVTRDAGEAALLIDDSSISSAGGSISLGGRSNKSGGTSDNAGISIQGNSTIETTSGQISMVGALNNASAGSGIAIGGTNATPGDVLVKTTSGEILINGYDNSSDAGASTSGVLIQTGNAGVTTGIVSQTGDISIKGHTSVEAADHYAVRLTAQDAAGNIKIGYDGTNAYSGDILFQGPSISKTNSHAGTGSVSVQSTGGFSIQPDTGDTTFTTNFTFDDDWNLGSSLTSLTFGKAGGDKDITFNMATNVAGPITIYGANIALDQAVTTAGTLLLVSSAGTITQNGAITADKLGLESVGTVTLDNAANDINTLAADVGSLTFVDADDLTIGSVNPAGVTATGAVNISTLTGDLTLSQNISGTTIRLNAGKNQAAGTATGGNIVISGTPSVTATTGNAILYSGNVSGSTGLADLIGSGTGNFRYNSDEAASNFSLAIGATGKYAVFREQPTITITPDAKSMVYGDNVPTLTYNSSGVNGDTSAQAFSTQPSVDISATTNASGYYDAGIHNLIASGATDQLGYQIAYSNGTLTVDPTSLTITAMDNSKTYDGLVYSGGNGVSYDGFVNGETAGVLGGSLLYGGSSQGAADVGSYIITPAGLTSNNYSIRYSNGRLVILPGFSELLNENVKTGSKTIPMGDMKTPASVIENKEQFLDSIAPDKNQELIFKKGNDAKNISSTGQAKGTPKDSVQIVFNSKFVGNEEFINKRNEDITAEPSVVSASAQKVTTLPGEEKGKEAGAGKSDENDNDISGTLGNQGNDKDVGNAGGDKTKPEPKNQVEDEIKRTETDERRENIATEPSVVSASDQKETILPGEEKGKEAGAGKSDENDNDISGNLGNQGNDKDVGNAGGDKTKPEPKNQVEDEIKRTETDERREDIATEPSVVSAYAQKETTLPGEEKGKEAGAGKSDENDNDISGNLGNQGNDKDVGNAGGDKTKPEPKNQVKDDIKRTETDERREDITTEPSVVSASAQKETTLPGEEKGKEDGAGKSDENSNDVSGTLGNQGNGNNVGNFGGDKTKPAPKPEVENDVRRTVPTETPPDLLSEPAVEVASVPEEPVSDLNPGGNSVWEVGGQPVMISRKGDALTLTTEKGADENKKTEYTQSPEIAKPLSVVVVVYRPDQPPVGEKGFSVVQKNNQLVLEPVDNIAESFNAPGDTVTLRDYSMINDHGSSELFSLSRTKAGIVIKPKSNSAALLAEEQRDLVIGTALIVVEKNFNVTAKEIRTIYINLKDANP